MLFQRKLVRIAVVLLLTPALFAETGRFSFATSPYRWEEVAPADFSNSTRLDALLRGGNLYLSLRDAIALALENNLDIAYQRYAPMLAEANLLRAQAGRAARSLGSSVQTGTTASLVNTTGTVDLGTSGGTSLSGGGTTSPSLDPFLYVANQTGHYTSPEANSFTTGTNAYVATNRQWQFGIQRDFLTGTSATLGWQASSRNTISASREDFNPYTSAQMQLSISQHLLQGFGLAFNRRNIRIAKNNQAISDLMFRQQVVATVAQVVEAYWDLVSYQEDLRVKQQAVELSQRLYENTRERVRVGAEPQISIARAEMEVASNRQQVVAARTLVLEQETALKTALSRTGVASPAVADAHVVPTDRIEVPEQEAIEPVQDLVARALESRPEVAQARVNIENTKLFLKGTRNGLLPSLDLEADFVNSGLAGQWAAANPGTPRPVDPFFTGGFGRTWAQILSRNFPDYSIGFQLSIPLRNRAARADMIADQVSLRQQEIGAQRQVNTIRQGVRNAVTALEQARGSYEEAAAARSLAERILEGEQKKYQLGATDLFYVVSYQRDLAQMRALEVRAASTYAKARVNLDYVTGRILEAYDISIDEALKGKVSRAPDEPPVLQP